MKYIFLLICLSISVTVIAQKQLLKQADKDYADKKYAAAIPGYMKVVRNDSTNITAIARLADCFRKLRDSEHAVTWYAKAVQLAPMEAEYQLCYAEALAGSGRYTEAAQWFGKQKNTPQSQAYLNTFHNLVQLLADSASWKIGYLNINSGYDDFGPVIHNNGLLFVSNRPRNPDAKVYDWDQSPFLNLFFLYDLPKLRYTDTPRWHIGNDRAYPEAVVVKGAKPPLSLPENFNVLVSTEVIPFEPQLNTNYHEGPVSMNRRQDTMYVSSNNYYRKTTQRDQKSVNRLKIYISVYRGNKWEDAGEFPYNSNAYSSAHPALHPDGNVLYFVSDRPGGLGGTDIYYCLKQADVWGEPINAGPLVNTAGNEMFPYISPHGELYFSSDGRGGLGGLDVFRISLKSLAPSGIAANIGYPVNSKGDDFSMWVDPADANSGYFSSNRYGSDDIFMFRFTPSVMKK